LAGSDMLIVNPQHYAVALRYDAGSMSAPTVTAKGRNYFALYMRTEAAKLSIAIFERPALARSLFRGGDINEEISAEDYRAVALPTQKPPRPPPANAEA